MAKLRVAVLFGGVSSEYEVSLRSAASVIRNIPKDEFEVVCIGITKKGRWLYFPGSVEEIENDTWFFHADCVSAVVSPDRAHQGIVKIMGDGMTSFQRVDCVFPVLHGKNGEDGTVQGLLTLAGLPYVGCDTISSAMCMDKAVTHTLLEKAGVPMAPWQLVTQEDYACWDETCARVEKALKYPVFIKPANAGSSVGVSKAADREQLRAGVKMAFAHDRKVLVEKAIEGMEVECAVLGNEEPIAAQPGRIISCNEFYDYDAKYIASGSVIQIPAEANARALEKVRQTAVEAFRILGCGGMARVDFFITPKNEVLLNEINTIPGFTSISMYPKMWEAAGLPYGELLRRLIHLAVARNDSEE